MRISVAQARQEGATQSGHTPHRHVGHHPPRERRGIARRAGVHSVGWKDATLEKIHIPSPEGRGTSNLSQGTALPGQFRQN